MQARLNPFEIATGAYQALAGVEGYLRKRALEPSLLHLIKMRAQGGIVRRLRPLGLGLLFLAGLALGHGETASRVFEHALPNVPGKDMTAVVVEYPPGASSVSHRHAASGFIFAYVLEGRIRSQLEGEASPTVYTAGEHWYEMPGAHHVVSENASDTKPARLLAVFVADSGATLTTPD